MTMSGLNSPIRAIALALLVTAIGCNPDDELSGLNDWGCPEIYGDGTPEQARELAIEYDPSEYESLVGQYGYPIDEGYFGYDNGGDDFLHEYIFLFTVEEDKTRCYNVDMDGNCVTYQLGCNMFNDTGWFNTSIEDCDCSNGTRIE